MREFVRMCFHWITSENRFVVEFLVVQHFLTESIEDRFGDIFTIETQWNSPNQSIEMRIDLFECIKNIKSIEIFKTMKNNLTR